MTTHKSINESGSRIPGCTGSCNQGRTACDCDAEETHRRWTAAEHDADLLSLGEWIGMLGIVLAVVTIIDALSTSGIHA